MNLCTSVRLNDDFFTYMKRPREIGYVRFWTVWLFGSDAAVALVHATMLSLLAFSRA